MTSPGVDHLVLQEFRLSDGASHAEADGVLAAAYPDSLPLLTSISDDRDVASVRSIPSHASAEEDRLDLADLDDLVSRWQPLRTYRPRIAESSLVPPTRYHLAVTESGLNDGDRVLPLSLGRSPSPERDAMTPLALLWIGAPAGSYAGLLVLVGDDDAGVEQDAKWPLPLSQQLGVRIYRGSARD